MAKLGCIVVVIGWSAQFRDSLFLLQHIVDRKVSQWRIDPEPETSSFSPYNIALSIRVEPGRPLPKLENTNGSVC